MFLCLGCHPENSEAFARLVQQLFLGRVGGRHSHTERESHVKDGFPRLDLPAGEHVGDGGLTPPCVARNVGLTEASCGLAEGRPPSTRPCAPSQAPPPFRRHRAQTWFVIQTMKATTSPAITFLAISSMEMSVVHVRGLLDSCGQLAVVHLLSPYWRWGRSRLPAPYACRSSSWSCPDVATRTARKPLASKHWQQSSPGRAGS